MTDKSKINYADLQNLMFAHPSDGPGSLGWKEKLAGLSNYRSWRRNVEIGKLPSTKRRLGFVPGRIPRPTDDTITLEQ